jgi:hypothetical protein
MALETGGTLDREVSAPPYDNWSVRTSEPTVSQKFTASPMVLLYAGPNTNQLVLVICTFERRSSSGRARNDMALTSFRVPLDEVSKR